MSRLQQLDALRGIAALMVAASHFNALVLGGNYILGAGLAVDFFFMLSGYIMARTYEGRMPSPPSFLLKRMRRLWPALALGTALGAAMGLAPIYYLPLALAFLPIPGILFAFNPPAWSLFYELVANVLHASLLARLRAWHIGLLLAAIMPAWALLGLDGFMPGDSSAAILESLFRVVVAYAIGVVLWRRFGDRPSLHPSLGAMILALCLVAPAWASPAIVALLFPIAILSGFSRAVSRPGYWLGRISYPLYAVHFPIMLIPQSPAVVLCLVVLGTSAAVWLDGLRKRASPSGAALSAPQETRLETADPAIVDLAVPASRQTPG